MEDGVALQISGPPGMSVKKVFPRFREWPAEMFRFSWGEEHFTTSFSETKKTSFVWLCTLDTQHSQKSTQWAFWRTLYCSEALTRDSRRVCWRETIMNSFSDINLWLRHLILGHFKSRRYVIFYTTVRNESGISTTEYQSNKTQWSDTEKFHGPSENIDVFTCGSRSTCCNFLNLLLLLLLQEK